MRNRLWIALLACALLAATHAPRVVPASAVGAVGLTVSDADASAAFFARVLGFTTISDVEASGRDIELLYGVFGARVRVVRMALGDESIELTEFLAPRGRAYPADTRANDQWFQHIAIVTSNMKAAYEQLRA